MDLPLTGVGLNSRHSLFYCLNHVFITYMKLIFGAVILSIKISRQGRRKNKSKKKHLNVKAAQRK